MRKYLSLSILSVLFSGMLYAQEPVDRPHRTPEEEAMKQTIRLVRELEINDSIRFDTIYRMHLKYARWRQKGLTRAENMQRMQAIHDELKQLLTPEEYERFMNHPSEVPHRQPDKQWIKPAKPVQPSDYQPSDQPTNP